MSGESRLGRVFQLWNCVPYTDRPPKPSVAHDDDSE